MHSHTRPFPLISLLAAAPFATGSVLPALTLAQEKGDHKPPQILTDEEAKKRGLQVRPVGRRLPFEALPAPASVEGLSEKLGGADHAIWIQGDVLNILHRSSAKGVQLSGGLQMPMTRVAESDLWIVRLKMDGWQKAFFSYVFMRTDAPPEGGVKLATWYGPAAPAPLEKAKELRGRLEERTVKSEALGEERKITVYIPPNAPRSEIPAFFMADGQGCRSFASALEPLILSGKVRPIAIVGIHSGTYQGTRTEPYDPKKDLRGLEYVPGEDPDRFDKHMEFFTGEVGEYTAREFNVSRRRENRAVFGFSNGGSFSAAVAVKRPDFFANSMPLSAGIPFTDPKPEKKLPIFHFAAGKLETFSHSTTRIHEKLKKWGADSTLELFLAGHDPVMWEMAFARFAPTIFPSR